MPPPILTHTRLATVGYQPLQSRMRIPENHQVPRGFQRPEFKLSPLTVGAIKLAARAIAMSFMWHGG
jgi:hypothetical protein